jgi:hypothetical protein
MRSPIRHAFCDALVAAGLQGFQVVGDGGTGHVYLESRSTGARDGEALAAARRWRSRNPGLAEALYLRPNRRTAERSIHDPPRIRIGARARALGDLLLIAKTGWQLVDGSSEEAKLIGNHGGPASGSVPAIVLGGAPAPTRRRLHPITPADLGAPCRPASACPRSNGSTAGGSPRTSAAACSPASARRSRRPQASPVTPP